MPDSCSSDEIKPSPNLLSSLRNFRFASKTKKYQPDISKQSCSTFNSNSNNETTSDIKIKQESESPLEKKTFSPLGFRQYNISSNSEVVLASIVDKFQRSITSHEDSTVEVSLKLTNDELQRIKSLILQSAKVATEWEHHVHSIVPCLETAGENIANIDICYLSELLKLIKNLNQSQGEKNCDIPIKSELPLVQLPSKILGSYSLCLKSDQIPAVASKLIMDEYENFCSKEKNLRKLLDAFPGADIMEAQDILARCDWNLAKAMVTAKTQPLKCKKLPSLASDDEQSIQQLPVSYSAISSSVADEIVLDDSDEDIIKIANRNIFSSIKNNQNGAQPLKRARQIISSDSDSDEELPSLDVLMNHKNVENKQNSIAPSSNVVQLPKTLNVSTPILPSTSVGSTLSPPSILSKNVSTNSYPILPKGLSLMEVEDSSTKDGSAKVSVYVNGNLKSSTLSLDNTQSTISSFANKTAEGSSKNKSAVLVRVQSSSSSTSVPVKAANNCAVSRTKDTKSTVPKTSLANDRDTSKSKESKSKRRRLLECEDEDDDYGDDHIYDSDDSDYCEDSLTSAHAAVLKFFQEATPEELGCVNGCSKKKVDLLISLRPFKNWGDLVQKISNDRSLNTDLLNGAKKVVDTRTAITKLMLKCQQISIEMEDLVEDLKENKECSSDYVSKQPCLLNDRMHLTPYQMLGLNWMLLLHNQEVNGILADEMGLGKTVQAIAFMAYLKEITVSGPHLIVVPSSVMDNWKQELQVWWPNVSMIIYHGSQENRRELRYQILNDEVDEFDVMITTYNMITSNAEDRGFFKRLEFDYVIFDEAHMLKNMASQRYQHLMKIKATRRLLLTGTPLQNNLVELMSLLIFAMPHMFSGKTEQIKLMFSSVSKVEGNKNTYEKNRIEQAKKIMKPFVLRRLKKDVLQDLPAKIDDIKYCKMTNSQAEKYAGLVKTFSVQMAEKEKQPSNSGVGMMMQLRRAANHPLLLRRFYDDEKLRKMSKAMLKEPTHKEADANLIFEDMSVMSDFELYNLCKNFKVLKSYTLTDDLILDSGKFAILDTLLPACITNGHRVLIFSQFTMVLDIINEYMRIRSYKFLRLDGQVPVQERQQLIDQFNSDPSIFIFLLSTRAGGLGINLTAADTVVIHDIDFNPYNDKQAEDRCHRVGQVREVTVTRLISENTIEEGIMQRAKEKLNLERDIHEVDDTEENDVASVARLLRDALGLKNSD